MLVRQPVPQQPSQRSDAADNLTSRAPTVLRAVPPVTRLSPSTWHRRCSSGGVTDTRNQLFLTTTGNAFDNETKWCESCQTQVRYLMSVKASYCTDCGSRVRLFSKVESVRFAETVQKNKYCTA